MNQMIGWVIGMGIAFVFVIVSHIFPQYQNLIIGCGLGGGWALAGLSIGKYFDDK